MSDALVTLRLIRKLQNFTELSEFEKEVLNSALTQVRNYSAHEDMVLEGEPTGSINVILAGLACRQKMLPDGRRQIIGFLVPGDICDVRIILLRRMDHTITAMSPVKVGILAHEAAVDMTEKYPRLARALWWSTMVEESVAREWLVNVGQRTALERLAHLFCEIYVRLHAVGLAADGICELPLTQAELADTLALSTVHVNRTLRELRQAEIISFRARSLIIHDFPALQSIGMFDPNYLHLDGSKETAATRNPSRDERRR